MGKDGIKNQAAGESIDFELLNEDIVITRVRYDHIIENLDIVNYGQHFMDKSRVNDGPKTLSIFAIG